MGISTRNARILVALGMNKELAYSLTNEQAEALIALANEMEVN